MVLDLCNSLEVEVELQNAPIERTLETLLVRVLPFFVDYTESEILVRRSDLELQDAGILITWFLDDLVGWRLSRVHEIRAENRETVGLDDFWWWIIDAVGEKVKSASVTYLRKGIC